jgi:hypothetical protein
MSENNGRSTGLDALGQAEDPGAARDHYAQAVLEARLGRPPRDLLEATVVLEAWAGRPARSAMTSARRLINLGGAPPPATSDLDPPQDYARWSVIAEGITLVLLILSVAAWATPIRRQLGPNVLSHAIRVSLPIAVALQWGLRSRYLSRPSGLACLAREGGAVGLILFTLVDVPLAFIPHWGIVAAILLPIWVIGTIVTMRGWGLIYAAVLVAGTVALGHGLNVYAILGSLAAITLLMCVAALRTHHQPADERAGTMRRAILAALIGGCVGVLLVGDNSLGWGVHGIHPAIALLPSVIGSIWGGYYLWNFYDALPRGLRGVSLRGASRAALSDPAMSIFLGGAARLILATVLLTGGVVALHGLTHGTDAPSVFVAFGCVGLVCLLLGLLEAFSLQYAALVAAAAALGTEFAWQAIVPNPAPGTALALGAAVGVGLTVPLLALRLARSGRVLATTLWIQ